MRQFKNWDAVVLWMHLNRDVVPDNAVVALPIMHPLVVDRWIAVVRVGPDVRCEGDVKCVGAPIMLWDARGSRIR